MSYKTKQTIKYIVIALIFCSILSAYIYFIHYLYPADADTITGISILIIFGVVFIIAFLHTQLFYKKNIHSLTNWIEQEKNDLLLKIETLPDEELLPYAKQFLDNHDINTKINNKPIIEYLIFHQKTQTLKLWLKNGANMDGYEKQIESICSKSYTFKDRFKDDFRNYFADRI